jgi:hypothetical protein
VNETLGMVRCWHCHETATGAANTDKARLPVERMFQPAYRQP